jgi:hypothetical protein
MRNALALAFLLVTTPLLAADYSGKWTLDKAQSADLPPFYEHVSSHALTISQTDNELTVGVDITADSHDPDHFDFVYRLDGTPVQTETKIRTPQGPASVPTALTARPQADGTLVITIDRKLGDFDAVTLETWHLAADGQSLVIDRTDDTPRGKFASKMVFVKLPGV